MTTSSTELPNDVAALRTIVLEMRSEHERELRSRDALIRLLLEWKRLHQQRRFGPKSEKDAGEQGSLLNEAEATVDKVAAESAPVAESETTQVPAHTRAKPGRRPLPEWIPRVEVLHDVPDAEKRCATHDILLDKIGEDTSEQLEVIPMQMRVIRTVRPKYSCAKCRNSVTTAPVPLQLIPKSFATPSFLAYVAVSKYADALPLYRLAGMLERHGIDVSRATLAHWMVRFGEAVEPLLELMRRDLRKYDVLQGDETHFPVLKEPGKPATSHAFLWVLRGGPSDHPLLVFEYDPTRSKEVAKRLLAGFEGYFQTDGYGGYTEVGQWPGIVHVGCWAHARRKFIDALDANGGRSGKAARVALCDGKSRAPRTRVHPGSLQDRAHARRGDA